MHSIHLWLWITRLGEAGIILPAAGALSVWLVLSSRSVRLASSWLVPLGFAVFVTTASKIAFIGWGIGIASLDFTGFSGHSMFAAAIYPVLGHALAVHLEERQHRPWRLYAVIGGYALAVLIAVSRVMIGAHSVSEIVAGFALGAAASAMALWLINGSPHRLPARWLAVGLASWMLVMPLEASPSNTHGMVTRLALKLANRSVPFQRRDLHRQADVAPQPVADLMPLPAIR